MIDCQVPTGKEIYTALFGLFKRAQSCNQQGLRKTLFPGDPKLGLSVTYVPFWAYNETIGFVKMLEGLILLHKQSLKKETRLRLVGYCHIMESDFPFAVIWNLLRIINAQEPSPTFFRDEKGTEKVCEYPKDKIPEIANLAGKLKEPIGDCLTRLWVPLVRNALSHSQYTLMCDYSEHRGYMMRTDSSPISRSRKSFNKIRDGKGNPSFDDIRDLYQGALALLNSFDEKYNEAKQNMLNTTAS